METVVSGIRSTGNLHLGNYFGALSNFVKMQHKNRCFFFIADYHALTTHPTAENIKNNAKQVIVEYLAAGLDPEIAVLYLQSDVPEVLELYLFLNMNAYLGELQRCTSFKDKIRLQPNNVNAGLLTYPSLMAADILIHKADKVPVGKDQEQHLEMTRLFASRFNRMYKVDYFKEPQAYNYGENLVKIPGLDGSLKMGKSEGNAIYLSDSPEIIRKKVMKAKTDSGPTTPYQEKSQEIQNLFLIMQHVAAPETITFFENAYNDCSIRYGDLKKQLAEDIVTFCSPIRERILTLSSQDKLISEIMDVGAEKARQNARKTIAEIREIIGFRK